MRMRVSGFCMSWGLARTRIVRRQPRRRDEDECNYKAKQSYNSIYAQEKGNESGNFDCDLSKLKKAGDELQGVEGNRVMVVMDSSAETKAALQWALSHTVQPHDTIVLLHVVNPFPPGANSRRKKAFELLCSMKDMCETRKPGVHVDTAVVEGKEKGATIVAETKQQKVTLLVLGQRKRSRVQRLRSIWQGKRSLSRISTRVVEHCIQYTSCMTIAVRRKSNKYGGYLITTKRHKNFWLLA
ncbi:hypothetical protein NMG60_11023939 [Bertholletia excelsa]